MKGLEEVKSTLTKQKQELFQKYGVKQIGIFGSYVRGEQKKQSDVGLLVEFEEASDLTFLDFIGLENYLSTLLGVKVDLVEKHTLKQRIGKRVLEEVVNI
jgi:predicted nucleotidyltransferase